MKALYGISQYAKNLIIITAFSLIHPALFSQTGTGTIKGIILTSDQKPAAGVTVLMKDSRVQAVSEATGAYSFNNLNAGNYVLITSFTGLVSQTKKVTLTDGQVLIADFILSESEEELKEVIVTAQRTMNEKASRAGKISIPAKDLPQSIVVIGKDVLEKQQPLHLSDVLKNVNGVYVMGTTGGTQEEIAGRGYAFGSNNTFKNGVRFNNAIMPEMSSLESVEVLKGSNAILYGNVAAGGVLNLVTKKPLFETGGEVSMRVGSYGFYKPAIDIYGAINNSKKLAYRVNGAYEKANSFRDNVASERFYINPSLLYKISGKTEILLEIDYLKDNRTTDYGIGAINYTIPEIPRSRFIGSSWSYNHAEQKAATLTTSHQINSNWQLKNVLNYSNYSSDIFGTTRPNAAGNMVKEDGSWTRGVQRSEIDEKYYFTQLDLTGHFETGKLKHSLLLGADADRYFTNTTAYINIPKFDTINIFDLGKFKQRDDIPVLSKNTLTTAPINRLGVYVQDLISISEKLKFLAGIRYTHINTGSDIYNFSKDSTTRNKRNDNAYTPRLGIVYQPTKNISIFTSYANSFTLNNGIDTTGTPLAPSLLNQFEAGIKTDLFNKKISANVTVYQIINSNLAQTVFPANPAYPTAQELAGEVTSKGVEVDIMTKPITGFTLIAGYSYNDTRYTKSNTYIEGSKLRYNPQHTANASLSYNFSDKSPLKGLNVGVIAFYTGERMAGRSTRITLDNDTYKLIPVSGFTQVDFTMMYTKQKLGFRVKASNIFNALSYYLHDDNSINPVAPRQFAASVFLKF